MHRVLFQSAEFAVRLFVLEERGPVVLSWFLPRRRRQRQQAAGAMNVPCKDTQEPLRLISSSHILYIRLSALFRRIRILLILPVVPTIIPKATTIFTLIRVFPRKSGWKRPIDCYQQQPFLMKKTSIKSVLLPEMSSWRNKQFATGPHNEPYKDYDTAFDCLIHSFTGYRSIQSCLKQGNRRICLLETIRGPRI